MSNSTVIIGAGAWGQALAYLCFQANPEAKITLVTKKQTKIDLQKQLANAKNLTITDQINGKILDPLNAVIIATPSKAIADILTILKKLEHQGDILCAAKGFVEDKTVLYPHELYAKINPNAKSFSYLYGPTFADEVMQNLPTQAVLASSTTRSRRHWQKALHNKNFQTIVSSDLKGLAWCSVFKNIVAIISGCMKACKLGHNAQALLITHATMELHSIIKKINGHPQTAYSLAGIGDIVLSATSNKSRNFQFGEHIATHKNIAHTTIEGKANLELMYKKLKPLQKNMPSIMKLAEQCISNPKQCKTSIIEWMQMKAQYLQQKLTTNDRSKLSKKLGLIQKQPAH